MTDPESGSEPAHLGAPADTAADRAASGGAQDGGPGRAGSTRNASPDDRDGSGIGIDPEERGHGAGAPVTGTVSRKRKRRRRGRKAASEAQPDTIHAVTSDIAPGEKAGDGEPRGRKARSRKRRALQGRPLTCERQQHSDTDASAGGRAQVRAGSTAVNDSAVDRRPPHPGGSGMDMQAGAGKHAAGRHGGAPLYAALDLGTNNCRLLIAQPTRPGQFRVVDAFSRIVRLGEGLIGSGRLSQGAMDRAVEALKVCAAKLDNRPVRNRRLIATEACRSAANGAEFLDRVRREAGLELEVVDRQTEARLAVSGCSSLVDRAAHSAVLFDIGGGSSEIAVIDLARGHTNRLASRITAWTSLPVGVVTLSEQHGGREVTPAVFDAMVRDVETMLARFDCPQDLTGHHQPVSRGFHLLGTSGTVTTLAGVYLDLPRYDRRRVDGLWLSNGDVDRMMQRLLSWNFDQRSANPCIGADRADLVLAGCAILEAIRRRWPAERMRVADRGLREGLLTEMMAADGVWRRNRRGRRDNWLGGPSRMGAS